MDVSTKFAECPSLAPGLLHLMRSLFRESSGSTFSSQSLSSWGELRNRCYFVERRVLSWLSLGFFVMKEFFILFDTGEFNSIVTVGRSSKCFCLCVVDTWRCFFRTMLLLTLCFDFILWRFGSNWTLLVAWIVDPGCVKLHLLLIGVRSVSVFR